MGMCYATEFMPRGKMNARDDYVSEAIARFDQQDGQRKLEHAERLFRLADVADDVAERTILKARGGKLALEARDLITRRR